MNTVSLSPTKVSTPPRSLDRGGYRVLIVDDSPIDLRLAGAIVSKMPNSRVSTAENGAAALEQIARELPHVVLTDLQMDCLNGLELVERIRKDFPELPVVLMTAHGSEDVAMEALRRGATNYVPKRRLARELGDVLQRVISLSSIQDNRRWIQRALKRRESTFVLENDAAIVTPLIESLQEEIAGLEQWDRTVRMRIGIALEEALRNALYHGNLEVSSSLREGDERAYYALAEERSVTPPYCGRRIHIMASVDHQTVKYVIRDEGPGFDTSIMDQPIDPEALMMPTGRGLLLIRMFMDDVQFNSEGNEVTLIKHRETASPS